MVSNDQLAELLFPNIHTTIEDLEKAYPPRNLKEGAQVTRFAPSPTGFLHTGSLFTSMISYLTAKKSGGVYFFRLEDTDTKRTVSGSDRDLIDQLAHFGIEADEGYFPEGDKGAYGPYRQSDRADIYKAVIKELIRRGRAYPDFCTPEELDEIRKAQEAAKVLPGYYGAYARDRVLTNEERVEKINAGVPWVIRFASNGDHERKVKFTDAIRGEIELQDNDTDVVILKSDGLPTYHFAHVVDDHFMRTTMITRGEEWIPSTPIHLDMFRALGWKPPKYAHIPSIMKLEDGNRRKLSKRKDPEAAVSYFLERGYPTKSLLVYLMSIANSNFEEWTIVNKSFDFMKFPFSIKKVGVEGALFDQDKLDYFSKEVIAYTPLEEEYAEAYAYAKEFDPKLFAAMEKDPSYIKAILNIDKQKKNPRKDYAKYGDVFPIVRYFFDEEFDDILSKGLPFNPKTPKEVLIALLNDAKENLPFGGDESTWFEAVKAIGSRHGYASSNKDYKENPSAFLGSVSDCAEAIRVAIVGVNQSPSLHEILEIIGQERILARLGKVIASL